MDRDTWRQRHERESAAPVHRLARRRVRRANHRAVTNENRVVILLIVGLIVGLIVLPSGATIGSSQSTPNVDVIDIEVRDARGPDDPNCRATLGLPPIRPRRRPDPPAPLPALPPPSGFPTVDPAALPMQAVEGSPKVLEQIRDVFVRGDGGDRIRLTFFGDSHTSADWWTGHIRRLLQDRWGDLGHGFVMPAAIYRGYRGQDVNLCSTRGWRSDWTGRRGGRADGLLGFAGMSVSSANRSDFGWIQTTVQNRHGRRVNRFRIYALGQPEGGTLRVDVDHGNTRHLSTAAAEPTLLEMRIAVPDGPHRLRVAPSGDGEVRLLGVSMERAGGGAIVDTIGIRGRQAKDWLAWDPTLASAGLVSLDPDLLVLAYGTNEAFDARYSTEDYRIDLHAVLSKLRMVLPDSIPCLLVGPSDLGIRTRSGWRVSSRTEQVAQTQREAALAFGCAFWDWQAATGGAGSIVPWVYRTPPLAARDGIHYTRAGYEVVAEKFLAALEGAAAR